LVNLPFKISVKKRKKISPSKINRTFKPALLRLFVAKSKNYSHEEFNIFI